MNLEKKPFIPYKLEEEKDKDDITFTVRITKTDKDWFEEAKKIILQPKNSTALKQLAKIGFSYVLQDQKLRDVLDEVVNNYRRNSRIGITDSEYKIN